MIKTLILINNSISDMLANKIIKDDKINYKEIFLIKERKFNSELEKKINKNNIIEIPVNSNFLENFFFIFKLPFILIKFRNLILSKNILNIFLVNNVSIFGASIILFKRQKKLNYKITTLVEGLMNFEEEKIRKSSNLVILVKKVLSLLFFLPWKKIEGHASGAFNPEIYRVITFSKVGLYAPKNKIKLIQIKKKKNKLKFNKNSIIIIHSPLNNIFGKQNYIILSNFFLKWLKSKNFKTIYYKFHPNHKDIYLFQNLPKKNLKICDFKIEGNYTKIPSKNIISFFSTSLFTLKKMYPELNVYSFGVNFYHTQTNQKSYNNLIKLYKSVDIKFINV